MNPSRQQATRPHARTRAAVASRPAAAARIATTTTTSQIQKALEVLSPEGKAALVAELEEHVFTCVHDQNGNHVIQKAVEWCPPELRRRVTACFVGATLRLAQHPYGCRVVQVSSPTPPTPRAAAIRIHAP